MIISFKHKGLERFFKNGNKSGIQTNHAARLHLREMEINNHPTLLVFLSVFSSVAIVT